MRLQTHEMVLNDLYRAAQACVLRLHSAEDRDLALVIHLN